jgi:hypothetical protein
MKQIRLWLAAILRTWAERMDPDGAVTRTGLSFTYEDVPGGMLFRTDGLGCPLYRVGDADLQRAHDDAGAPAVNQELWTLALAEAETASLKPVPVPE